MDDKEARDTMTMGFELLCTRSRMIAQLPLEDWDRAFENAETVGPILDPTLYRQYLYSEKGKVIRELIRAAIPLKQTVLEVQSKILDLVVQGKELR